MKKPITVDEFILENKRWQAELNFLRKIFQQTKLVEEIKWGAPTYTSNQKNVLGMAAFKNYVGIWFHQGVFLKDIYQRLLNAQEGKTKALRQWRFTSLEEIEKNADLIKTYIEEAIQNQKLGKELKPIRNTDILIPKELEDVFTNSPPLKKNFESLTPGKKKEYVEYVNTAKREATKQSRIEKIIPMIERGMGLNDSYRSK